MNRHEMRMKASRNRVEARRLHDEGKSIQEISKILGLSPFTLKLYVRKENIRTVTGECKCGRPARHRFKGEIVCDDCLCPDLGSARLNPWTGISATCCTE